MVYYDHEVTEAYEALINSEKRRLYDRYGKDALSEPTGASFCGAGFFGKKFNEQDPFGIRFQQNKFSSASTNPRGPPPGDHPGRRGWGPVHEAGAKTSSYGHSTSSSTGHLRTFYRDPPPVQQEQKYSRTKISSRPDIIPNGQKVLIFGLKSAPQHNQEGAIIKSFDELKKRYVVELLGGSPRSLGEPFAGKTILKLKPDNLCLEVENVKFVSTRPELADKSGKVSS